MNNIKYLLLFLMITICAGSNAQVEFYAEADPKIVTMGKSFNYTITSNKNGKVKLPALNGFTILSGPHFSSFSQSTFINGVSRKSVQYTWSYELMPDKTGNLTIREASIVIKGKTYQSNTLTIRVLEGNELMSEDKKLEPVFVGFSSDKSEIYLGEEIILSYDFYNRYELATLRDSKLTPQKGGWVKELTPSSFRGWTSRQEVVNHTLFEVTPLKKEVIVPNSTGKYIPEKFEMTIATSDSRYGKNIFRLVSKPYSVRVKPLPAGQPESFTGLVGNFSFSMKVNKNNLRVNEGFEILVTVKGSGNLQYLEELKLDLPEEMEVFKPEVKSSLSVSENGISGTRQFKFLVIPRKMGNYSSGPLHFSWFDPRKEKYYTTSLPAFDMNVSKGIAGEEISESENSIIEQEDVLMPLKKQTGIYFSKKDFLFGAPSFLLLSLALPVVYFFSLIVVPARKKKEDPARRAKNAERLAIKQLKTAHQLMENNDLSGFYEENWRALNNFIAMKFNLEQSQLSRQSISSVLKEKGIDNDVILKYISLIENCEMARFAKLSDGLEKKIYHDSLEVIQNIEEFTE